MVWFGVVVEGRWPYAGTVDHATIRQRVSGIFVIGCAGYQLSRSGCGVYFRGQTSAV